LDGEATVRTIEIDFEVHKLIEMERTGFDEPPISALRRLLGLRDVSMSESIAAPVASPGGRGWSGDGVHLPHGTLLRMTYNGRSHHGRIDGESWSVEGGRFASPSGAATTVALTKKGRHTRLDGWNYWEAKLPGSDSWVRLGLLRLRARRQAEEDSAWLLGRATLDSQYEEALTRGLSRAPSGLPADASEEEILAEAVRMTRQR
jgi:hypothetical protein